MSDSEALLSSTDCEDVFDFEAETDPELEEKLKMSEKRTKRDLTALMTRYAHVNNDDDDDILRQVSLTPNETGVSVVIDAHTHFIPLEKTPAVVRRSEWVTIGGKVVEEGTIQHFLPVSAILQGILKNEDGSAFTAKQVNKLREKSQDDLFCGAERCLTGMGPVKYAEIHLIEAFLERWPCRFKFWFE